MMSRRNVLFLVGIVWLLVAILSVLVVGASPSELRVLASIGLGLFFLGLSRWGERELQLNLLISAASLAFPLALGESYFRVASLYPNLLSALTAGVPFDTRSPAEVVLDSRAEGKNLSPTLDPIYCLTEASWREGVYPLASQSNALLLDCNEDGTYATFTSDEHGFRNPRGFYQANSLQAILVGDSFTHGACVAEGQEVGAHLRSRGIKTLNLGHGGNGPLLNLATLMEFALPLKPRVIFWLHYEGNDFRNLAREREIPLLQSYLSDPSFSQDLLKRQAELDQVIIHHIETQLALRSAGSTLLRESVVEIVSFLTLYQTREALKLVLGGRNLASQSENRALFAEIIGQANSRAKQHGIRLVLVYLPEYFRLVDPLYSNSDREFVKNSANELGIPLVDVTEFIKSQPEPLALFPFKRKNHYNSLGYQLVAQALAEYLQSEE